MWLRKDPIRWLCGGVSGLFAGGIAVLVSMICAHSAGLEMAFPVKLLGTILEGPSATDVNTWNGFIAGALLLAVLCVFLGAIFSHFVGTNSLKALVPMGLVWGIFSWIFIWNLFFQSFPTLFAAQVASGVVFIICISFGLSLTSVAFFDSVFRLKPRNES